MKYIKNLLFVVLIFISSIYLYDNNYADEGFTIININKNELESADDVSAVLQEYLNLARDNATENNIYKIVMPAGEYDLNSGLRIFSNTYLCLDGVTLNRCGSGENSIGMFRSGNAKDCNDGYSGYKNITIEGGVLNANGDVKKYASNSASIIRIAHATNVTLKNVTLKNGNNLHYVEVAAIDEFNMINCKIEGRESYSTKNTSRRELEAVQFDVLHDNSRMDNFGNYDDTPMKNINVTGCTFNNVQKGIGSHAMVLGEYVENVNITGNTFTNITKDAIAFENYKHCTITNNTIKGCGVGINFKSMHTEEGLSGGTAKVYKPNDKSKKISILPDCDTIISNNTIEVKATKYVSTASAILVQGENISSSVAKGAGIVAGDYFIKNVTVSGNNITTDGVGIKFNNTRNSIIDNNKVVYNGKKAASTKYNICLYNDSKYVTISNNNVSKSGRHGIYLVNGCSNSTITKNTISNSNGTGIRVLKSGKGNKITYNKVNDSKNNGIVIEASNVTISNNTLSKNKGNGIAIESSGVASIKNNKITSASSRGITVSLGGGATISSNTIKKSGLYGIDIQDPINGKSTVSDNNKISSSGKCAIHIKHGKSLSLKNYNDIKLKKVKTTKKSAEIKFKKINGVTKYTIYRKTGSGKWTKIATTKKLTYIDKKFRKGKKYQYKIGANSKIGKATVKGIYSNVITVK